jgi:hypothetical protein
VTRGDRLTVVPVPIPLAAEDGENAEDQCAEDARGRGWRIAAGDVTVMMQMTKPRAKMAWAVIAVSSAN